MILKGTQRSGGIQLARHLLKDDNDHVTIHEVRGFISETLEGAFKEAYAISRGTKCKQYLFSLSLNPPRSESVTVDQFEAAIEQVEDAIGLKDQPRAIVFHEKKGRRHAHCVWSRIDVERMTAIQLAHSKLKLRAVSQQIYQQFNWQIPQGLRDPGQADPFNYSRDEAQQAKRIDHDPKRLKAALQKCWQFSDGLESFEHAAARYGFALARGDRRGFVLVNQDGEVFSANRWLGVKSKVLSAKFGDLDELPTIQVASQLMMDQTADPIMEEIKAIKVQYETVMSRLDAELIALRKEQESEREKLIAYQEKRQLDEAKKDEQLIRGGLLGLWDRLVRRDTEIRKQIEERRQNALLRDREVQHELIQRQIGAQQYLHDRVELTQKQTEEHVRYLIDEMVHEESIALDLKPHRYLDFDFTI